MHGRADCAGPSSGYTVVTIVLYVIVGLVTAAGRSRAGRLTKALSVSSCGACGGTLDRQNRSVDANDLERPLALRRARTSSRDICWIPSTLLRPMVDHRTHCFSPG